MRIAMISPSLGDGFGQERVIHDSTQGLKKAGHSVYLIGEKKVGALPEADGIHFIPSLFSLPHLLSPFKLSALLKDLSAYLKQINPNVVHFIDQPHHRVLNYVNHTYPTVLTAHTVGPTCPASHRMLFEKQVCHHRSGWSCLAVSHHASCLKFLKNDLHRAHALLGFQLKHRATKKFKKIVAISQYIQSTLIEDGFTEQRVCLIYNPVAPFSGISPLAEAPPNLLVSACRLVPLKGIEYAIRALKKIENTPWTYWICGEGTLSDSLKSLVRHLNLEHRIFFKGKTPRAETLAIIKSAKIFLQTNVGPEAFGLSVAESLSLGIPTIAFDIPALNEIIDTGQNGWLIPSLDIEALSRSIKELLADTQLQKRFSANGPVSISKRFSPELFLKQTLSLYTEVGSK